MIFGLIDIVHGIEALSRVVPGRARRCLHIEPIGASRGLGKAHDVAIPSVGALNGRVRTIRQSRLDGLELLRRTLGADGEVGPVAIGLQIALALSTGGGVLLEIVGLVVARRFPDEDNLLVRIGLHTLVTTEIITVGFRDTLDGKVHVLRGIVELVHSQQCGGGYLVLRRCSAEEHAEQRKEEGNFFHNNEEKDLEYGCIKVYSRWELLLCSISRVCAVLGDDKGQSGAQYAANLLYFCETRFPLPLFSSYDAEFGWRIRKYRTM